MGRTELMAMEKESDSIYVNNHSYESSLYAAGGVIELCKAVMTDRIKNGFAIVRPPGHHAESNVSMGFCFINNVAIATKYCLQHLGLRKIMIVDWDVHFGKSTLYLFLIPSLIPLCL
jgi:histone deacetylase 6